MTGREEQPQVVAPDGELVTYDTAFQDGIEAGHEDNDEEIERLRAENERLRSALRMTLQHAPYPPEDTKERHEYKWAEDVLRNGQ